uniref:Reverse transcriptase domain-containing protein n=1 Tax=Tanacetum cinerariifolium TaxID=118510 RepID=A0A6L2K0Y8_TANCI|nr:hypothetical protein [Tanacetum cinerariifolium]
MSKTHGNYGSGVARPKIGDKTHFELKGQFPKELRENTFSRLEHEDAHEHIEKVLEIVDLFHIREDHTPYQTHSTVTYFLKQFTFLALVDLEASVNVVSFSTYTNLGLGDLSHTRLTIELADKIIKHPRSIAENVLVRIGKFIFPIDFIILDMPEDDGSPLILERPFLSIAHAKIDVFKRKITLRIGEEKLVFKSIKSATSIIRRVYVLKEGTDLDSKTKFIGEANNESFHPHYGFSIIDDMDITSGVVLGMPFCKKFVSYQRLWRDILTGTSTSDWM